MNGPHIIMILVGCRGLMGRVVGGGPVLFTLIGRCLITILTRIRCLGLDLVLALGRTLVQDLGQGQALVQNLITDKVTYRT